MSKKTKKHSNQLFVAIGVATVLMAMFVVSIRLGHYFQSLEKQTDQLKPYQELYRSLAGYDNPQKTLLVLANNAEIRTGGGFIGTLGLIKSEKGKIKADSLVGVYNVDSPYFCNDKNYTQPEYIKSLNSCTSLRDSNNYLDYPNNAQRVLYFYQLNTAIGVDNVVQITPQVLEVLLGKLGPVYLKDYDLTVTKENFRETVQLEVEAGKDKQQNKDPKSGVIGSLANQLVSRLISKNIIEIKDILPTFQELIDQKQIVLFSKNNNTQNIIRTIGASGELKTSDENYFMFTESNIAANKSSPYIKNTINMHQTIMPDGSSQIDLNIISNHTSENKINYIDPNTNQSMWLIGADKNYVTLALPKESQVTNVDANGQSYDVTKSNNKLLLGYNRSIQPLGQSTASFKYTIPTKYLFDNRMVINTTIQKQLGGWPYELNYSITLPSDSYQLVASTAKDIKKQVGNSNTLFYNGIVNQDSILSFIYEKH